MAQKEGSLNVSGSVAYVTQSPWIQNLTVQGNILFGLPMNTSRYYRAITACELSKDLETMKAADQTEVRFAFDRTFHHYIQILSALRQTDLH